MIPVKKYLVLLLALVLLLTACGGGDVRGHGRHIGTCEMHKKAEIADAMDEVEAFFKKNYDGCKLILLEYDEEKTADKASGWTDQYGQEAIVLLSDFEVDESGGDGSLNPGQTYRNYQWILVKTFFGWKLKDWGYG